MSDDATCLKCGQREVAPHGDGFKCRACGAEEPAAANPHLRKDGRLRGETLRIKTPRTAASFTVEQRLEELLRIADKIEYGTATPVDEIALKAHLRVLTGRGLVAYEEDAITKAASDV